MIPKASPITSDLLSLDKTAIIFPGSRLRIRFAMRPPRRIGLAFPGSPVERGTVTEGAPEP
jgi:hypothetical protein